MACQLRDGKTPCSAMQKLTVKDGAMLSCGCPPPAFAMAAVEHVESAEGAYGALPPVLAPHTFPTGLTWPELVLLQEAP